MNLDNRIWKYGIKEKERNSTINYFRKWHQKGSVLDVNRQKDSIWLVKPEWNSSRIKLRCLNGIEIPSRIVVFLTLDFGIWHFWQYIRSLHFLQKVQKILQDIRENREKRMSSSIHIKKYAFACAGREWMLFPFNTNFIQMPGHWKKDPTRRCLI